MRVGDCTRIALAVTPAPEIATVLPLRKLVCDPVSSTSSPEPCGTVAGLTAASAGRTAEIPRLASVFE